MAANACSLANACNKVFPSYSYQHYHACFGLPIHKHHTNFAAVEDSHGNYKATTREELIKGIYIYKCLFWDIYIQNYWSSNCISKGKYITRIKNENICQLNKVYESNYA